MPIEVDVVYDWMMEINLKLFQRFTEELRKAGGTEAAISEWETDFAEYVKVQQEVHRDHSDGDYKLIDVASRIPHNKWVKLLSKLPEAIPKLDVNTEELRKTFHERLEKKKQGIEYS